MKKKLMTLMMIFLMCQPQHVRTGGGIFMLARGFDDPFGEIRLQGLCGEFHSMLMDYAKGQQSGVTLRQIETFYNQNRDELGRAGALQVASEDPGSIDYSAFFGQTNVSSYSCLDAALLNFILHCHGERNALVQDRVIEVVQFLLGLGSTLKFSLPGVHDLLMIAAEMGNGALFRIILKNGFLAQLSRFKDDEKIGFVLYDAWRAVGNGLASRDIYKNSWLDAGTVLLDVRFTDADGKLLYTESSLSEALQGILQQQFASYDTRDWALIKKILNYHDTPHWRSLIVTVMPMMARDIFSGGSVEDGRIVHSGKTFDMSSIVKTLKKLRQSADELGWPSEREGTMLEYGFEPGDRWQGVIATVSLVFVDFMAHNNVWNKLSNQVVGPHDWMAAFAELLTLNSRLGNLQEIREKVKSYAAQDPYNAYWQEIEKLIDAAISERQAKTMGALDKSVVRPTVTARDQETGKTVELDPFSRDMQTEVVRLLTGVGQRKPLSASEERAAEDREAYREQVEAAKRAAMLNREQKERVLDRKERVFKESLGVPLPWDDDDAE